MSNCNVGLAFANEEESFAIIEDNCGTLKKPGSGDRIYSINPVDFAQGPELLDDEQIRSTASRYASIRGLTNPGDWSFNTYVKPSGTPGTAPEHDILFQSLMGDKQVNAGVSVVYSLASQLDSFSLWTKKGHTVYAFRGTTVERGQFNVAGNAIATIDWSGRYMEQLWAGTIDADDNCGLAKETIQLPSGGAQLYVEGMYVEVGTDDNGGDGYELTDVNYTNDTITISPTLQSDQGLNPEITPWWPTASAEVGEPVHGKRGLVTVSGADAIVYSARVTVVNNIKYYIEEKNNTWTAERFGRPKIREIDGELEWNFLERGPSYFYRAAYEVSDALVINAGNVAGYILAINIPIAEYLIPKVSGDEEVRQTVPFRAIASSGNDECSLSFT